MPSLHIPEIVMVYYYGVASSVSVFILCDDLLTIQKEG